MLTSTIKEEIKSHANSVLPEECCGYIVEKDGECLVVRCKNISSEKEKFFEIDPRDYLRALNVGNIVAVYHSQKSPSPSHLDCANTRSHGLRSIVYSWEHDSFCEADEKFCKFLKYVGRKFEIYKMDCFSLVRDFYEQEYGIKITNYFRDDNWFKNDPKIIEKNYKKEGFFAISGNIKQGDVAIFDFAHFGIFLDENTFLHHPRNRISTIEKLNDIWKKHISLIVRHESR